MHVEQEPLYTLPPDHLATSPRSTWSGIFSDPSGARHQNSAAIFSSILLTTMRNGVLYSIPFLPITEG